MAGSRVSSATHLAASTQWFHSPPLGSSYTTWLNFLFATNKQFTVKYGLSNISRLHAAMGEPLSSFEVLHVAGTNGKGSVCWKAAAALQAGGHRTGLFMSPHISSYRERFSVNGALISEADVERLLPQISKAALTHDIPASFFEYTMMLGLLHFAERDADVVVLETGLGGLRDGTNICQPLATAITSVSMDHPNVLGDTLELIAREKAGIIKPGVPVVVGPAAPQRFLRQFAADVGAPFVPVAANASESESDYGLVPVDYDAENTAIATCLVETALARGLMPRSGEGTGTETCATEVAAAVRRGLLSRPPCRYEEVRSPLAPDVKVILDVAHNEAGIAALLRKVKTDFAEIEGGNSNGEGGKGSGGSGVGFRVVVGFSAEKAVRDCLSMLLVEVPRSKIHFVQSKHGRAMPLRLLEQMLEEVSPGQQYGGVVGADGRGSAPTRDEIIKLKSTVTEGEVTDGRLLFQSTIAAALAEAQATTLETGREEVVIVCGSGYMMSEVKHALGLPVVVDSIQKL